MRKVMVSAMVWNTEAKRNLKQEKGEALFHQFGVDHEEFDGGPGNYTAAVVEWPDGQVELVPAHHVRFMDSATKKENAPLKVHPIMIEELEDLLKTISHCDISRESEDNALEAAIDFLKRFV